MAQEYDKIIKENLEKIVLQLISKTTNIEPVEVILKQEQKITLSLDIKNDLLYQQGEKGKAIEIASHMLKKGLDKNLIAETTGLSLSEIEKLAKDFGNK